LLNSPITIDGKKGKDYRVENIEALNKSLKKELETNRQRRNLLLSEFDKLATQPTPTTPTAPAQEAPTQTNEKIWMSKESISKALKKAKYEDIHITNSKRKIVQTSNVLSSIKNIADAFIGYGDAMGKSTFVNNLALFINSKTPGKRHDSGYSLDLGGNTINVLQEATKTDNNVVQLQSSASISDVVIPKNIVFQLSKENPSPIDEKSGLRSYVIQLANADAHFVIIDSSENKPAIEFLEKIDANYTLYQEKLATQETSTEFPPDVLPTIDNEIGDEEFQLDTGQAVSDQQETKQGVLELFESNPELAKIGTVKEYSAYLDTIFPDSKVKDIVYRGDKSKTINGVTQFLKRIRKGLLFLSTNKKVAKNTLYHSDFSEFIYKKDKFGNLTMTSESEPDKSKGLVRGSKNFVVAIVNIQNPLVKNAENQFYRDYEIDGKNEHEIIKDAEEKIKNQENDSLIVENVLEGDVGRLSSTNIGISKPEQIHILGSNKDIIGFKNFQSNISKPTIDQQQTQLVLDRLKKMFPGIDVEIVNELLTPDGRRAFGRAMNGLVTLNKNAPADTPPHEYLHIYIKVLGHLDVVKLGIKRYTKSGDTLEDAREKLVNAGGKLYANKMADGKEKNLLKIWLKKFWNAINKLLKTKAFYAQEIADMLWKGEYASEMNSDMIQQRHISEPEYKVAEPVGEENVNDKDSRSVADFRGIYSAAFGENISVKDYAEIIGLATNTKDFDTFYENLWDKIDRIGKKEEVEKYRSRETEYRSREENERAWLNRQKNFFVTMNSKIPVYNSEEKNVKMVNTRVNNVLVTDSRGSFRRIVYQGIKNLVTGEKNPSNLMSNFVDERRRNGERGIFFEHISIEQIGREVDYKDEGEWKKFITDGFLKVDSNIAKTINNMYYNEFKAGRKKQLRFIFGAKGEASSILVGYVPPAIRNMTREDVLGELQKDFDAGLMNKEHLDEFKEWLKVDVDEWLKVDVEGEHLRLLSMHRYWQQLRSKKYLLKTQTVQDMFNRLRITFSEGKNFIGIGDAKLMLIDKNETTITIDGEKFGEYAKVDGTLYTSTTRLNNESSIIGNDKETAEDNDMSVNKTAIEVAMDSTHYLGVKAMEKKLRPHMAFWRDGRMIAYSDAIGDVFVGGWMRDDRGFGGEKIDYLLSNNEAKQFFGKFDRDVAHGGLEETDGFYKVHTIAEQSVKNVITPSKHSHSRSAFSVEYGEISYFEGESWKEFSQHMKKYFSDVADKYLEPLFAAIIDPTQLRQLFLEITNIDDLHGELGEMLKQDPEGYTLFLPNYRPLVIAHIKSKLIRDGVFKARSRTHTSSQFWNAAAVGIDLKRGEFAITADNSTFMNKLVTMYNGQFGGDISNDTREIKTEKVNRLLALMESKGKSYNVILEKPPTEGRESVAVYKLKRIEPPGEGDVIFLNEQDAKEDFNLDFDGDKTMAINASKVLKDAFIQMHGDPGFTGLLKELDIDIFERGDSAVNSSITNRDNFYNGIDSSALAKGAQGMATNWQVISKIMAMKNLSFTLDINGEKVDYSSYQPGDKVVMDFAPLTKEAVADYNNKTGVIRKNKDKVVSQDAVYETYNSKGDVTARYTINPEGIITNVETNFEVDPLSRLRPKVRKIISGAQTGADMGGLLGAKDVDIETGGTAPPNFMTVEGSKKELMENFGLVEGEADPKTYPKRTEKNVVDSDGTVIFGNIGGPGTGLTITLLGKHKKPYILNPSEVKLRTWLNKNNIEVLNIAGNRESSNPGIQAKVRSIIAGVFNNSTTDMSVATVVHAGLNKNVVLSNFANIPFTFRGQSFATAEGAYQSWKSGNYVAGYENLSGFKAKTKGQGQAVDKSNNIQLMREILKAKYEQSKQFRDALNNSNEITHPVSDKFWAENFPKLLEELKQPVSKKEVTAKPTTSKSIGKTEAEMLSTLDFKQIKYEKVQQGGHFLQTTYENMTKIVFQMAVQNKKTAHLQKIGWDYDFIAKRLFKRTNTSELSTQEIEYIKAIYKYFNYSPMRQGRDDDQKALSMKQIMLESMRIYNMTHMDNDSRRAEVKSGVNETVGKKRKGSLINSGFSVAINNTVSSSEHLLGLLHLKRIKFNGELMEKGLISFLDDPFLLPKNVYQALHLATMRQIANSGGVKAIMGKSGIKKFTPAEELAGLNFEKKFSPEFWKIYDNSVKEKPFRGEEEENLGIVDKDYDVQFLALEEKYLDEWKALSPASQFAFTMKFLYRSSRTNEEIKGDKKTVRNVSTLPPAKFVYAPLIVNYAKMYLDNYLEKIDVSSELADDSTLYTGKISNQLSYIAKMEKVCP
jgi:hypothetical protein